MWNSSVDVAVNLVYPGHSLRAAGATRSTDFGRVGQMLVEFGTGSTIWATSAQIGPIWAQSGLTTWARCSQNWPNRGQLWQTLTLANIGDTWARIARVRAKTWLPDRLFGNCSAARAVVSFVEGDLQDAWRSNFRETRAPVSTPWTTWTSWTLCAPVSAGSGRSRRKSLITRVSSLACGRRSVLSAWPVETRITPGPQWPRKSDAPEMSGSPECQTHRSFGADGA